MGKAKKGGEARVVITLECTSCIGNKGLKNVSRYSTHKNKKNQTEKLQIKKYCRFERQHLIHKEIK